MFSLFHNLRAKRKSVAEISLPSMDGLEIKQVTLVKFLGVQIEENINQEQHINLVQC